MRGDPNIVAVVDVSRNLRIGEIERKVRWRSKRVFRLLRSKGATSYQRVTGKEAQVMLVFTREPVSLSKAWLYFKTVDCRLWPETREAGSIVFWNPGRKMEDS